MSDGLATTRRALRAGQARRGDERELALLQTAERLLVNDAFEATSLAAIARESGVSRPGFYFYFASKDALLSALIIRTLDRLVDSLAPSHATELDPTAALHHALRAAADLWYEHRAVLTAASELGARDPSTFDRVMVAHRALVAPTSKLLRHGTHVRNQAEARALAEMLTWMAERNFYMLSRQQPSRRRLRALADRMLEVWVTAAGLETSEQTGSS